MIACLAASLLIASSLAVPASLKAPVLGPSIEKAGSSVVSPYVHRFDGYVSSYSFEPSSVVGLVPGHEVLTFLGVDYNNEAWTSCTFIWDGVNIPVTGDPLAFAQNGLDISNLDYSGYHHLQFADYANAFNYGNITDNIGSGFALTAGIAKEFNDGLALFWDGSKLTNVGTFAFTLMGLGIALASMSLCWGWLTSRHGM